MVVQQKALEGRGERGYWGSAPDQQALRYAPITTAVMRRAAELWAQARARGRPTADPAALDCDVIIAAQAELLGAIVVTENARHLALFVDARHWRDIPA